MADEAFCDFFLHWFRWRVPNSARIADNLLKVFLVLTTASITIDPIFAANILQSYMRVAN
ncbi:hypothetical protein Avi_9603 (plasmid) [Allorhizobium ampelinum S4]|uniref:Uncharacterized protein n=1 Tax=Allorhizobium ampelinum (strain ATCC BAA-846 / DSM 112012 / S4) TaxID=311402 RepID=B9K376_ALLAM|nr:hypothetical protein Avi_9603 [Allorhizobium ampelinum S4]